MEGRIIRAMTQRMYLLACRKTNGTCYSFVVEGSAATHYLVTLNKCTCACTCPDFAQHGDHLCKHILFILARVGKTSLTELPLKPTDFLFSAALKQRIDDVLEKHKKTKADAAKDPTTTTECGICYEDFAEKDTTLHTCTTCTKKLHSSCMAIWKTTCFWNSQLYTCPYCRAYVTDTRKRSHEEGDDDDCLSKLSNQKLKIPRTGLGESPPYFVLSGVESPVSQPAVDHGGRQRYIGPRYITRILQFDD